MITSAGGAVEAGASRGRTVAVGALAVLVLAVAGGSLLGLAARLARG